MPLGKARKAAFSKGVKRASRDSSPDRDALKRFRKELKESSIPGQAAALLTLARKMIGTAKEPRCHSDLKQVMGDVRAGRFVSAPDEAWMRRHSMRAFADLVWAGQFDAFLNDEEGGLTSQSSEYHRVAAYHVLAEVFCWYWAVTSGAGASEKVALCPNSLYQAITNDSPTALRLWNASSGMFLGGLPSPVGFKAGTVSLRPGGVTAAIALATTEVVGAVNAVPLGQGGRGGGGRGGEARGGRRSGCNYCRVQRGVIATDHMAEQCPHWAHVKAQRVASGLDAPPVSAPKP